MHPAFILQQCLLDWGEIQVCSCQQFQTSKSFGRLKCKASSRFFSKGTVALKVPRRLTREAEILSRVNYIPKQKRVALLTFPYNLTVLGR